MRPRRQARVLILHGLYQMDVVATPLEETIRIVREEASVPGSLNFVEEAVRGDVLDFFEALLRGIWEEKEALDRQLEEKARNWSLNRLTKVDLNLLRMGTYELLHRPDIPAQVTISEALEMALDYGDEKARAFVNGVLDAIHRKMVASTGE